MKLSLGRYEGAVRRRAADLAPEIAHAWERDAAFWGGDERRQASVRNRLGWLTIASEMMQRLPEIEAFAAEVRAAGIVDVVVLGMGGSSLAPEVLARSLGAGEAAPRLHVVDSTDPSTIAGVRDRIDPRRSLFVVSSKSGTTIEANTLFAYFEQQVREAGLERAGEQFVAITDPGTPLLQLSTDRGFRRAFVNPADIGGRYSALSYFGMVPAAAAGIDVRGLLERGRDEAEAARDAMSAASLLGAALGQLCLEGRYACTFVPSPRIRSFGLWAEQLIAESTGKEGRGILPVDGEPLLDVEAYGDDRFFVYLRLEGDDNGRLDVAVEDLRSSGLPVIEIPLAHVHDLGREFMRWEFAVAVAGRVLGINPFDEPNVQESKDNTKRVLHKFEASGHLDVVDDRAYSVVGGQTADVGSFLDGVTTGQYFAITAYIEQTPETDAGFAMLRKVVAERSGTPTTLGYGPRFLHSTGQLHKGGPPAGVFLQVTAADARDVRIPGYAYTFGQLKRAQALGDFASLEARGRPVVRVHLGEDVAGGLDRLLRDAGAAQRT